ncbi:hypothetical protein Riv7116_4432 [Rivularia sp. PCC 7116]|nr:hypothetical protein Riv7116_4432 [Rivularia sp. PCC 7116]
MVLPKLHLIWADGGYAERLIDWVRYEDWLTFPPKSSVHVNHPTNRYR